MTASRGRDERSFLRRLLTTPFGQLLRGRATGALDPRHIVATANLPDELKMAVRNAATRASWRLAPRAKVARRLVGDVETQLADGRDVDELLETLSARAKRSRKLRPDDAPTVTLPPELQRLVATVVRKTHLSRREKRDVCAELSEHFRDGLAAGESTDDLTRAFGDVGAAARLIRRAKIRGRSWQRQLVCCTVRATQLSAIGCILLWGYLAARYFGTQPNIARNYLAEMDEAFVGIPAEKSAWPLYREALMDLTPAPEEWPIWDETGTFRDECRTYATENQPAVTLSREAAERPRMGFAYQDRSNGEWLAHSGHDGETIEDFFTPGGPVIATLLPHIQEMRTLGRLLIADAWTAAERGDGNVVVSDVSAVLAMSRHVRDTHPFFVSELVSLALSNMAAEYTGRLLEAHPDALGDEQLARLADALDQSLDGGQLVVNFDGERAMIADTLQRIYSDDGNGNGYVTQTGMELINIWMPSDQGNLWKESSIPAQTFAWMTAPLAASRIATRQETRELVDDMFSYAAVQSSRPRWIRESIDEHPDFGDVYSGGGYHPRWGPLSMIITTFDGMLTAVDESKLNREATLTILALHRYHGRHNSWPDSLDQLVPDYLDALPVDQANGETLRYRLGDGQPLLYSVGGNVTDDGGISPTGLVDSLSAPDGDWVLWPLPNPEAH